MTTKDGMFFAKTAKSPKGRFFQDLSGRSDGSFYRKLAEEDAGDIPEPPDAGGGGGGEEGGGGMYGTGAAKASAARMKALIAKKKAPPKLAAAAPSDWDADLGLPTGWQRQAVDQPEALELGGERFHSTEAKAPTYGAESTQRHGLVEGGAMKIPATSGHQMGKHASQRFLGTTFAKKAGYVGDTLSDAGNSVSRAASSAGDAASDAGSWVKNQASDAGPSLRRAGSWAKDQLGEAGGALREAGGDIAGKLDEGVKKVTRSPALSGIGALLGGGLLLRGMGRRGMRMLDKHGSAQRFLGTAFSKNAFHAEGSIGSDDSSDADGEAAERWAGRQKDQALASGGRLFHDIGGAANQAVNSVTKSPLAVGLGAILLGRMGLKAGGAGLRGIGRAVSRTSHVPQMGKIESALGSLRRYASGARRA